MPTVVVIEKLIFVYNAISGARNLVLDTFHKTFRPATYECNLCQITFGLFTENTKWKKYRNESHWPMTFLHKDEFAKQYASKFGYKFSYPIILVEGKNGLQVLIGADEINQLNSVDDLIAAVQKNMDNPC
ncbi:MAG: GTPase [Croceitalea sp.]|nr:GTPase [Croceitalea sp.]